MKKKNILSLSYVEIIAYFFSAFWAFVGFVFELEKMMNDKGDLLKTLMIFVIFIVLLIFAIRILISEKKLKKEMDRIADSDKDNA